MITQNRLEVIPVLKGEIRCMKDMYNLGKEKKVALSFLYFFANHGFSAANLGFKLAWNKGDKEEFKKDSKMFSKTAKEIDELLETTMEEREKWLEFQNDFEKNIK